MPTYSRHAVNPKPGEALMQSAGWTHLMRIGEASDLPTLSRSFLWRRVSQLQEVCLHTVEISVLPELDPLFESVTGVKPILFRFSDRWDRLKLSFH